MVRTEVCRGNFPFFRENQWLERAILKSFPQPAKIILLPAVSVDICQYRFEVLCKILILKEKAILVKFSSQ